MEGKHSRPSQCERIINYLNEFGEISQLDALRDLGCMRLASRISEMRRNGQQIKVEMRSGKNRYGETTHYAVYSLEKEA